MKKILILAMMAFAAVGCYEDYALDYMYDGVYATYQYDLRSFLIGECMEFKFGVVLGGVQENTRDRDVQFVMDGDLLKRDLSAFGGDASFDAVDGLMGYGRCGVLSQGYVSEAMEGVTSLKSLPSTYYELSDENHMTIEKGWHSASITLKADASKLLGDKKFGVKPYYAVAFRILKADADTILKDRSFEIIAVRAENMFFGDWYHGGKSVTVRDATGEVVSNDVYATRIPCDENTSGKYTLTSVTPTSVTTSYFHNRAGSMTITMDGENVGISDADGRITDLGCGWNNARLLQDRKIFLNYKYTNTNGTTTTVTDTLSFRARLRDGVNEWQDPDPKHYN